jgi:dipeptidyl aminopeptidase/acylaminoacyl peptidase
MKNLCKYFLVIPTLILFFTWSLFSTQVNAKSPVTFDSLYSFESVTDVQLSPDGKWITFVTQKSSVEENKSLSRIWLMEVSGKNMKKISPEEKSAWQPCWVEQGKGIAFLSVAASNVQVFSYDIASGNIKQVTDYASGIKDFLWSPTNEGLAFVSPVYPGDNSLEYYLEQKKKEAGVPHSGKLYEKLLFRPYSVWDDGTITHIFYFNFKDGSITDVTPGDQYAPTSHLGGSRDISFSADGKTIAFTMNTDPVKTISTNNDVFSADLSGQHRKRISTGKGSDVNPRFSPDGKYFLYTQMAREQYESDQKDIILIDLKSGSRKNLTENFDRTLSQIFWLKNSKHIYFTCDDKGYNSFYVIDVSPGQMNCLLENVCFSSVNIDSNGKNIIMIKSTPNRPGEVCHYDIKSKTYTQLTHFSDDFVTGCDLAKTETFWYRGAKNDPVMGFISFPADFDKNKKYPLIFLFHGGPEGAWTANYSNYVANIHLMAARGYITVKINPHGSSSYGLAFQEAILGNWGIVDVEDVLKGLDYLIKEYPCIDPGRIAGLGRSYGGFLVNYLNGKTNRFKCFIAVDGIFDQVLGYYTTDELWFMENEFKGTPFTSPEIYKRSSPMTYVENFNTPCLVIHGGRDYRVDLSQGIAMYTALQRKGVPSQLLIFPDEPHYFRKLQTWKYVYQVQFEWLERWLK